MFKFPSPYKNLMKNIVEYILFVSLGKFICLFTLSFARRFSVILAYLFYYVIPIRKETVYDNLKKAFPEYDQRQVKTIAFKCYRSFLIALIEIFYMQKMNRDEIINAVQISNADIILEKYKQNKGVILLSAHFGNWEYIAASVSARVNVTLHVVVKNLRNPYVNKWINKVRTRWNNKIVPLGISIREVYKELMNKNLIAMVADQRGPSDGIRVNFFGINTAVHAGPAVLALKTGAPVIYGIAVRQPDYSYKVVLEEISTENLPNDEEAKIIEVSQRHTSYLEKYIRQYPEQWFWMHKRWKY
jgi:Kdo2-lipid IVA lauroyltransferase/acyltransferase